MPGPFVLRAGRGGVFSFILIAGIVTGARAMSAEEVLFPQPLHFVREVTGIDGDSSVFHEYCAGNQVVTVTDGRVAVADYAKGELLEIDHVVGTYSITSFADLATAARATPVRASTWKTAVDAKAVTRTTNDAIVLENGAMTVELRAHESISVPRRTLDVLLGAAWPNPSTAEHELAAEALRAEPERRRLEPVADGEAAERFAIPASRIVTMRVGPDIVRWQNAIVAVDNARVPPSALIVPAGFRLVESVKVQVQRELQALEENPCDPQ